MGTGTDNSAGQIAAIIIWSSLLLSPLLAGLGVLFKSRGVTLASALVSTPYACYLAANPAFRLFIIVPVFHVLAALLVNTSVRWISWILVILSIGFVAGFWLMRFGLFGFS